MGQTINWTLTKPGINKAQAIALALEFWTSQGFAEHDSSYNRLVLRRNKFGTVKSLVNAFLGVKGFWKDAPVQLTILVQVMPAHTKYTLEFELGAGWYEEKGGDFKKNTEAWVDEFLQFVNSWTTHTTY